MQHISNSLHVCVSVVSHKVKCLFGFQVLLVDKDFNNVVAILSSSASLIEHYQVQSYERESLVVFYLFLRVWHLLTAGQVQELVNHFFCVTV